MMTLAHWVRRRLMRVAAVPWLRGVGISTSVLVGTVAFIACGDSGGGSGDPAPMFMGLGDLSGGSFYSETTGISADGTVAVGSSSSDLEGFVEAFRWTRAGGMVGLGLPDSIATATSADGSVVVGWSDSDQGREAYRWTLDAGFDDLGDLPGGIFFSSATAISAGGSVVVGTSWSELGNEAFRWTRDGGMMPLGLPGGVDSTGARAISADGSVVVGSGVAGLIQFAFRWTQDDMVSLGGLPGAELSFGSSGISADGTVAVGAGWSDLGDETAFRWTVAGGMVGLGSGVANATSADGAIVVGRDSLGGVSPESATIWDATNGMRNLHQVLTGLDLDLTGWNLNEAFDISDDGRVIVGNGVNPDGNPEAWIAIIP